MQSTSTAELNTLCNLVQYGKVFVWDVFVVFVCVCVCV